jgi:hypothetical protein
MKRRNRLLVGVLEDLAGFQKRHKFQNAMPAHDGCLVDSGSDFQIQDGKVVVHESTGTVSVQGLLAEQKTVLSASSSAIAPKRSLSSCWRVLRVDADATVTRGVTSK